MKIVFLTQYYAPEVSSVTHLFSDLAEDLVRMGHSVEVVCARPNRGLSEEQKRAYRYVDEETPFPGLTIRRTGRYSGERGGLVRRGIKFLGDAFALYAKARSVESDVVLVNSMPPYLGLAGALLHRRGRKTCYLLQDLFPDSVIAMGKLPSRGPLTALCRRMESISLRGNDLLVTISGDMKATLLEKGVPEERIRVIPNWADVRHVSEEDAAALRHKLGIADGTFCAVYAGALGILQTPEVLLDAAKLLGKDCPDAMLAIFGSGGLESVLRERIERERIGNVRLFPIRPVTEADLVYALGDVCLVPLKRGVERIAMPSKTWTAMAAGRPVIAAAPEGSELFERVRASGGFCFEPEDAASLAAAIRSAHDGRDSLPARGEKARAYVREHVSRAASTRLYGQALALLAGEDGNG